ncbi:hypothetical protein CALCODRAFT_505513 [Calocera cornea HHB12733]|uniref:RRM domain-containing protein n=1 Tax=Calocera cornea HHB12733 TaxID=1353952 RepID=A0A165JYW3_9BASI|nr:hypothetical protein CALCODRAFT_505513 [Calocera cornea HHB12733]
MDPSQAGAGEYAPFEPHPLLQQPILYIAGLPPTFTEADLPPVFEFCTPYRPRLNKDGSGTGSIEFKSLLVAEKALVTLSARPLATLPPQTILTLSPFPLNYLPQPGSLPTPTAVARLVKHLPPDLGDVDLFELFRPYGPLVSVRRHTAFGRDTGLVEYWREEDAQRGEQAVHCADVGGYTVAVQPYNPRRAGPQRGVDVNAPAFIPRSGSQPMGMGMGMGMGGFPAPPSMPSLSSGPQTPTSPYSTVYTSPRAPLGNFEGQSPVGVGGPGVFAHGPGQQVQLAPLSGPGSTSASGLIDPCNLFIKNLDFEVDSHMLFEAFKHFGRIVSARVMRNDQGTSKGFGFVSYQTPEEAAQALHVMDGTMMNNKQIVVRLHEPKALRQEKLRERFSGNKRAQRQSGGASPVHSDGTGEEASEGQPAARPRRGSGSYYAAALQGNIVLHQDELSSLSPVVRREVLHGELSRRLKELDSPVTEDEAPGIIDALLGLPLDMIVEGLRSKDGLEALAARVRGEAAQAVPAEAQSISEQTAVEEEDAADLAEDATPQPQKNEGIEREGAPKHLELPEPERPGPSPTQGVPLGLSASAPEHPSSPVSLPAQATTKPLTPSPHAGSNAAQTPTTEREKLRAKVVELGAIPDSEVDEILDLLMTLSKKERALCAFNAEYLRLKVDGAREVVLAANGQEGEQEGEQEGDEDGSADRMVTSPAIAGNGKPGPPTPQITKIVDDTQEGPLAPTPTRPIVSPLTPSPSQPSYTLETLAALPAAEIMRIIRTPNSAGLPLPKADPEVIRSTDSWMDQLDQKQEYDRKQKLGEKLHKMLKGFGMRNAAKIAIALMDQDDLRSLAHLANEYPMVLREKAQKVASK